MRIEGCDRRSLRRLCPRRFSAQMRFRLDLRERERNRFGIAKPRQRIDPRAARIRQPQQFRNFIECFASRIVDRATNQRIVPRSFRRLRKIQVCMSAGDDQSQRRFIRLRMRPLRRPLLEQHRVDVPLQVVDGDQRQPLRKRKCLRICNPDKQCASQART